MPSYNAKEDFMAPCNSCLTILSNHTARTNGASSIGLLPSFLCPQRATSYELHPYKHLHYFLKIPSLCTRTERFLWEMKPIFLAVLDGFVDFLRGFAAEWLFTSQQLEDKHAQGPPVYTLVVTLALEHFRCQIAGCATKCIASGIIQFQIIQNYLFYFPK